MKERTNLTLSPETKDRLLQYGAEHHIAGGLSGVIEYIAWNTIKIKGNVLRGQIGLTDKPGKK